MSFEQSQKQALYPEAEKFVNKPDIIDSISGIQKHLSTLSADAQEKIAAVLVKEYDDNSKPETSGEQPESIAQIRETAAEGAGLLNVLLAQEVIPEQGDSTGLRDLLQNGFRQQDMVKIGKAIAQMIYMAQEPKTFNLDTKKVGTLNVVIAKAGKLSSQLATELRSHYEVAYKDNSNGLKEALKNHGLS